MTPPKHEFPPPQSRSPTPQPPPPPQPPPRRTPPLSLLSARLICFRSSAARDPDSDHRLGLLVVALLSLHTTSSRLPPSTTTVQSWRVLVLDACQGPCRTETDGCWLLPASGGGWATREEERPTRGTEDFCPCSLDRVTQFTHPLYPTHTHAHTHHRCLFTTSCCCKRLPCGCGCRTS